MKKVIKNFLISFCAVIIVLIGMPSYAEDSNSVSILTSPIPQEAIDYAKETASQHISTFLALPDASQLNEDEEIYLGNGFYTYTLEDGNLIKGNTINFPVIQNGEIVLLIHVIQTEDNTWTSGASYSYSKQLNMQREKNNFSPSIIIYSGGIGYLINSSETQILEGENSNGRSTKALPDFNTLDLSQLNAKSNKIFQTIGNSFGTMKSPIPKVQPKMAGFSVYTDTYKLLEMSNCFLLQNDEYGNQQSLCWAATAGTMIRYKTGNRTVQAWQIANQLGISYDSGGSVWDVYEALRRYGAHTDYSVCSRGAYTIVEVHHNINNRFPVEMAGGTSSDLFAKVDRHAVTLIGYNNNTLIYWNSATGKMETTLFNYPNTYVSMGGQSYRWDRGLMVPYGTPWSVSP